MRVGLNATCFSARPSGARQRFVGLYGALIRRCPDVEFLIYEPADYAVSASFDGVENVRAIAMPELRGNRLGRAIAGLSQWPARLAADKLDLFEQFNLPLVRSPNCPTILTIHDIRSTRRDVPQPGRAIARMVHRQALRAADRVITVSEAMKCELLDLEPSARVTSLYNGVDPAPFRDARGALPLGVARRFLLAVGHFEPRKNYAALVAAMSLLREREPDLGLVIVGKDGGTLGDTRALVAKASLGDRVHLLHDVDDATLAYLYNKALMLVFPSTYEGFGIPVLEAMAAGTPMALSDLTVFRELTQDRAAYFDPCAPASMAEAIAGLLSSPQLQDEQRGYGETRIADFTFPTLADRLAGIHRDVIGASETAR